MQILLSKHRNPLRVVCVCVCVRAQALPLQSGVALGTTQTNSPAHLAMAGCLHPFALLSAFQVETHS